MEMKKSVSKPVVDERVELITNKYAANAFMALGYYLFLSILLKSFILDVNIFVYWDNAISMVAAFLFMIYRSAGEGVPYAPGIFNKKTIKGYGFVSVLFGAFVAFYISGMDERLTALMPGLLEKLAGSIVVGLMFFVVMVGVTWIIDVLPTKRAYLKASELAGEDDPKLPDEEEIIRQTHVEDERINITIQKYSAHALYFVIGYILLSTLIKILTLDVNMFYYYDAFMAAMGVLAYFSVNIMNAGIVDETKLDHKDKIKNGIISVTACLAFGMFVSFIIFPMSEEWSVLLDGIGIKISFGLLMAALFGAGMHLLGKASDWYTKKKASKLADGE